MPRYIEENVVYGLFNRRGQALLHIGDIDVLPRVEAVEVSQLGELGRLMMPYKGCPRGRMGARGVYGGEENQTEFEVMALDAIEDIEGDRWVPVLAEDLNNLKVRLNNAVEVVHGRWIYEPVEFTYEKDIKCSVCGSYAKHASNYCPNCGAKMEEKVEYADA
jgi:hypothetical protein